MYKFFYRHKLTGKNLITHKELDDEAFELTGKFEIMETRNTAITNDDDLEVFKKPIKLMRPKVTKIKRK